MYRKVISLDPKKEDNYVYLGSLYSAMKRYDDAIAVFKQLEKINPNSLMSPYYLGRVYTEQQMLAEATAEYKRAISHPGRFRAGVYESGFCV